MYTESAKLSSLEYNLILFHPNLGGVELTRTRLCDSSRNPM